MVNPPDENSDATEQTKESFCKERDEILHSLARRANMINDTLKKM